MSFTDTYGIQVFSDRVMRERLSAQAYDSYKQLSQEGGALTRDVADEIACAMKDWAIEKGATHFTHWFQPMTGMTAEKHEAFIRPEGDGALAVFSGKELIKGESDASSFPSGGLRATFEARGYTAWDPTSYAFIKDNILYIPTIFCSYSGEALDHKTPLLRSMEALNRQAMRIIRLFGNSNINHVKATAGPEQEYFLVDKKYFDQREDLRLTGRTLFGYMPPKGQEMDDHYYGSIKTRVAEFMRDLNEELWSLGIQAKTEHNEVAPSQHELANNFLTCNVSTDQNNLTMEVMKKIAKKHDLECLLHEKPFARFNGSGKHNNWSIKTDTGINLFDPGDTPKENAQFLIFLCAIIAAVDDYQDLLRISISSAGNDERLSGYEAPPAIISIFLGDELTKILKSIENDENYANTKKEKLFIGVHSIPDFPSDVTDRNRTSPFAFTGNKFEFRMPGSSASIATPNTILNTVVAEELKQFADILENAKDLNKALHDLLKKTIAKHSRIIFNGNGYDEAWIREAKKRGLCNYASTPEALSHYLDPKNQKVFIENKVLSENELHSRYEIYLEKYYKTINIEALTMIDMLKKDILPAVQRYENVLLDSLTKAKELDLYDENAYDSVTLKTLRKLQKLVLKDLKKLEKELTLKPEDSLKQAYFYHDRILPLMNSIRNNTDEMERICDRQYWPIPSYLELLFGID